MLELDPLSPAIGAEILGVDLSRPLADATVADIRDALMAHCVVFFRDQTLNVERHKAFTRYFGELFVHPNFSGSDPEIVDVRREPGDTTIVGEQWHADTTMCPAPPMGAVLYARELPPVGGDTLFANQYLAWENLSSGMQRMLKPMRAWHSDRKVAGPAAGKNATRSTRVREDDAWRETRTAHPVAVTHPETGRTTLFVNHSYTTGFEGMTEKQSAPLLGYLLDHGHRPEFTCRFRWRPGSVAFWDNRSCKHLALHDVKGHRRLMRRTQLVGSVPACD